MRRLIIAGLVIAASLAAVAPAHASVPIKRCAWWNLPGGDEPALVIDQAYTTCSKAKAVGDAWLDHESWRPRHLYAGGVHWRLTHYDYDAEYEYRSLAYMARGDRRQVLLTYQWDAQR